MIYIYIIICIWWYSCHQQISLDHFYYLCQGQYCENVKQYWLGIYSIGLESDLWKAAAINSFQPNVPVLTYATFVSSHPHRSFCTSINYSYFVPVLLLCSAIDSISDTKRYELPLQVNVSEIWVQSLTSQWVTDLEDYWLHNSCLVAAEISLQAEAMY